MARLRIAVLISGRGSNLAALLDACAAPDFPAEIVCVIANVPGAAGLAGPERAGIATQVIDHKAHASRAAFEDALHAVLLAHNVELVCLAGFMRILTHRFVARWTDRLINIHPSLLPAYRGLDTHARALADGARFAGCTVHFVRADVDAGPIIVQAVVPVLADDDALRLATRVLAAEHCCYPVALRLVAEGRVTVEGGITRVRGAAPIEGMLINPAG